MHSRNPGWKSGDHWVECPRCKEDNYASQMIREWTGLYVCSKCWDPRHPGDFVRAVEDDQTAQEPVYPAPVDTVDLTDYDERLPAIPTSSFNQEDPLG